MKQTRVKDSFDRLPSASSKGDLLGHVGLSSPFVPIFGLGTGVWLLGQGMSGFEGNYCWVGFEGNLRTPCFRISHIKAAPAPQAVSSRPGFCVSTSDFAEVALGGIAAEYVTYGQANGGMSDIIQLEAPARSRRRRGSRKRFELNATCCH